MPVIGGDDIYLIKTDLRYIHVQLLLLSSQGAGFRTETEILIG